MASINDIVYKYRCLTLWNGVVSVFTEEQFRQFFARMVPLPFVKTLMFCTVEGINIGYASLLSQLFCETLDRTAITFVARNTDKDNILRFRHFL